MDISWIKIKTDIFDDEKIKLIENIPESDSVIVIWFKLLTLAGKSNNNGVFMLADKIPYTDEMLATIFRRPLTTIRLALQTFATFGMIDIIENVITIPKWQKHQNAEGLEKVREQTRQRVQKCRQKQIDGIECNATVTLPVTLRNATEKKREDKKREEKEKENLENILLSPQINQEYVNELFDKWNNYGFLNRGKLEFINRFSQIAPYIKGYHSKDIFGAIDNYKQVVDAGGWYASKHNLTFESFCKNINQFLPGNFDLRNYCANEQIEKIEKEKEIEDNRLYEICPCCSANKMEWQGKSQKYYCFNCKTTLSYEDVQKLRG